MVPDDTRASKTRLAERVAQRAFDLWLLRGFRDGSPEEDLAEAERQIRGETAVRSSRNAAGLFVVSGPAPKPGCRLLKPPPRDVAD